MTGIDLSNVKLAQQGEAYTWRASVGNVSASDLLAKAYLMLKTDIGVADGSASLSKSITPSNVAGTGQIVLPAGGANAIRFDLSGSDTAGLGARDYLFAIKVLTVAGIPFYEETGIFRVSPALITST